MGRFVLRAVISWTLVFSFWLSLHLSGLTSTGFFFSSLINRKEMEAYGRLGKNGVFAVP